jgi:NADH-quinone oxidoreductase subunit L
MDYAEVFTAAPAMSNLTMEIFPGTEWSVMTVICILLFIGAMGKSAQVPLHVWLPDSMEGPTPISALIHAATMVTAGIFMVARMSPLFELSETALSVVLVIGAITALFMGFLGIVANDIKRVIAYSTLSQLGYMTVALGASAYAAGIFHLMTHAAFKALLFLGAGSVIIALHHEQDIRKMGGLRKYMPVTYVCMFIGSLALIGFPGLAGFFSKDSIIQSVGASGIAGSGFAYFCVLIGVFVTAFYSFRMFFLVFHTKERMDEHTRSHVHESPLVVTVPLILLAIPSVIAGYWIEPILFGDYFGSSIYVAPEHAVLAEVGKDFSMGHFFGHGLLSAPFWLAILGLGSAWYFYEKRPDIPQAICTRVSWLYNMLVRKYGFDEFNDWFFAGGARGLGRLFWNVGDVKVIDGTMVNGSAKAVAWFSSKIRNIQTGYLYHYAFTMIIGLVAFIWYFVWSVM